MSQSVLLQLTCLALLFTMVTPAAAQVSSGCFVEIAEYFESTAFIDSFWDRTWAALDCELDFITCVRLVLFGR